MCHDFYCPFGIFYVIYYCNQQCHIESIYYSITDSLVNLSLDLQINSYLSIWV